VIAAIQLAITTKVIAITSPRRIQPRRSVIERSFGGRRGAEDHAEACWRTAASHRFESRRSTRKITICFTFENGRENACSPPRAAH
jgi:hypothetical protein